jgi:hypothetical protein
MQMPPRSMTSRDLRRNMMRTYFTLRLGIVALSFALPLLLLVYSVANFGGLVSGSMSAFYGGVMRDWFVGILWAIGFFLILYKGFSALEDWLLNFAGAFAVLTAMTPCNCWGDEALAKSAAHTAFAVLFFACMVCVCLFCARDTITLLPEPADQARSRRAYYVIALLLFVSPLAAVGTAYVAGAGDSRVFFIEWFAVWVFAAYWAVKSVEFKKTSAERRALYGALKNVKGVGVVPEAPDMAQLERLSRE